MTRCRAVNLALLMLAGIAACGGDASESEAAIDRIMQRFKASMLSGEPTLDPTLFKELPEDMSQLDNPVVQPQDSSRTLILGGAPADGTAGMEVRVTNTFTLDVMGVGTVSTRVVETATGFAFLEYTATLGKPQIGYRIPAYGLAALAPDGTGQAFVALGFSSSGRVRRTFTNVNPANGNRLIDFGTYPVPSGTASATGGGRFEAILELILERVGDRLEAKIGPQGSGASGKIVFQRDDEPPIDPMLMLSTVRFGGIDLSGEDLYASIGDDFPGGAHIAPDAVVGLEGSVGGIGQTSQVGGSIGGPFDFSPFESESFDFDGPSFAFSKPLFLAEGGVNDGRVQLGSVQITVFLFSVAGIADDPQLEHSLEESDFIALDLFSSAYLPTLAAVSRSIIVLK